MTIIWKRVHDEGTEHEWPYFPDGEPPTCFHCSQPIILPAIMWMGSPTDIWFHIACAAQWQPAFARDCWEAGNTLRDGKWEPQWERKKEPR